MDDVVLQRVANAVYQRNNPDTLDCAHTAVRQNYIDDAEAAISAVFSSHEEVVKIIKPVLSKIYCMGICACTGKCYERQAEAVYDIIIKHIRGIE